MFASRRQAIDQFISQWVDWFGSTCPLDEYSTVCVVMFGRMDLDLHVDSALQQTPYSPSSP